jgi:hypothetical protein
LTEAVPPSDIDVDVDSAAVAAVAKFASMYSPELPRYDAVIIGAPDAASE